MQPQHQQPRITVANLKAQIVKKLGSQKSKLYFNYLEKLLSLGICKSEFNELCFRIFGKQNIRLHNQFVASILRNGAHNDTTSRRKEIGVSKENGFHEIPTSSVWSNGHMLPTSSPKKVRSGNRGRRDHHNPLEPSGNGNQSRKENGDLGHHNNDCQSKLALIEEDGLVSSVHRKDKIELVGSVQDRKELPSGKIPLCAPLGIPFCVFSIGGAHRDSDNSRFGGSGSYDNGGLLDTETLREYMEQIAAVQGLEGGVSMDCVNLLNIGLDSYLKGLIRSCIDLVHDRTGPGSMVTANVRMHKHHQFHGKLDHNYEMRISNKPTEGMQEQNHHPPISLLDLKVAMELNPRQLGEGWPLLLEKITTHAFEQ